MSRISFKKQLARLTRRFRDFRYRPEINTARRIAEPLSIAGRSEMAAFKGAWDQNMPQFLAAVGRARALELEMENLQARVAALEVALDQTQKAEHPTKSSPAIEDNIE